MGVGRFVCRRGAVTPVSGVVPRSPARLRMVSVPRGTAQTVRRQGPAPDGSPPPSTPERPALSFLSMLVTVTHVKMESS